MADPLKERISLLQMGAAQGKLRPEHQAELNRYVSQGLVKGAPSPQGVDRDEIQERISMRSEENTSELQSLMRISYAVFCLKKKTKYNGEKTTSEQSSQHMHKAA